MEIKDSKAPKSTITYNRDTIAEPVDNLFEAISIIAKRANQLGTNLKEELTQKLKEFETHNEGLEEIFENKEQIEISKFYERMPKPVALAVEEWLEGKIYYRNTLDDEASESK
jgi:DNA-directed RNA polymerase subunit K/omega